MSTASDLTREQAEAALRQHWRHERLREEQWEVIAAASEGRDVLAVLPTGAGKSVCYQVPALLQDGLTLVVSPLVALMEDQVAGLKARGISAAAINGTLSARAIDQRWTDAEFGRYRLLYVSPERLHSEMFVARAARLGVRRLVVDEAHCISEWGHDFRPAYLRIAEARGLLGGPPVLAVTATATPEVRRDIVEHLALRSPTVLVRGFDRPNVIWSVFRGAGKEARVLDVVRSVEGTGIVYAATRQGAERWADLLTARGETAAAYHAGMPAAARAAAQEGWQAGKVRIVAATSAFGMGIDKPGVRFVIHADPPRSLEAYYQEAGRAGRDGEKAYAVLLFDDRDELLQRRMMEEGHPDSAAVRQVYEALCGIGRVAVGARPDGPVSLSYAAVSERTGFSAAKIEAAVDLLVRQEVWIVPSSRHQHAYVRFRQPAGVIRQYAQGLPNRDLAAFVDALLRAVHADAFKEWWEIDLRRLARRLKLPRERLLGGFEFLRQRGFIDWSEPGDALRVLFTAPRPPRLAVDDAAVRRAFRRAETRLGDVLRYARSVTCRRHFLLSYFGEESPPRCGRCDYCLGRHRPVEITPEEEPLVRQFLDFAVRKIPASRWHEAAGVPQERIDQLVGWLLQERYLTKDARQADLFAPTEKALAMLEQWRPRR